MNASIWMGWQVRQPKKTTNDRADKRNQQAIQKRAKQEEWVVEWVRKEAPSWLEGNPDSGPTDELVERLLAEIDLSKGEKRRWRRNFLLRALNRGARELGWRTFPQQPIIKLWLRGSPINATTFPYIRQFTALRDAFSGHWKTQHHRPLHITPNTEVRSDEEILVRQGQILLSGVLFGGLASRARLAAVAQHALSRLDAFGNFVWVDWPENPDDPDSSWQRWLPDQGTGLLIARALAEGMHSLLPDDGINSPEKKVWVAIQTFLATLNLPKESLPTSLRMLLEWSSVWHFRHIPPFLAAYAKGELDSCALPPHVWLRHIQQRAVPNSNTAAPISSTIPNQLSKQPDWPFEKLSTNLDEAARNLRNILRGKSPEQEPSSKKPNKNAKQIRQNLRKFLNHGPLPAILQLLCAWILTRIVHGSSNKAAISVALAQLESIDRLLIDAIGFDDMLSYPPDRIMNVYISVIDASRSAKRHNLRVAALGSFQRYLEREIGFTPIASTVFDELPENGCVDANFFSPAHNRSAQIRLSPENSRYSPSMATMHQIALMLSSKTGLRRGEITRLRLEDVRGDIHPVLVIRHRPGESLKSNNAVRVMPLSHLLETDELAEFRGYVGNLRDQLKQRLTQVAHAIEEASIYLFPSKEDICKPTPEPGLFNPIEETLRNITGDSRIRMHHGRHSAINLIALRLLENILPGCSAPFIDPSTLGDIALLQEQILGNRAPSRQQLWAVALLAGHGSPEITFGSYFHLCDWLLHFALRDHPANHWDAKAVAHFLGTSYQKVSLSQRQLGLSQEQWVPIILNSLPSFKNRWPAELRLKQLASAPELAHPDTGTTLKFTEARKTAHSISTSQGDILNACQILNLLNDLDSLLGEKKCGGKKSKQAKCSARTIEGIAQKHQISTEQAELLWKASQQLEQIRGNSGFRKNRLANTTAVVESLVFHGVEIKRPIPRVRPVLNKKERDCVNAIFWQLESIWCNDQGKLNNWLFLHWQHWRVDRHALRFGFQERCVAWLDVIRQLAKFSDTGIALDRINLIHEANGRNAKADPAGQLEHWVEALALPNAKFVSGESLQKPKGQSGDGIIEISFPIELHTSNAWIKQRAKKGIRVERQRANSLALDAAAYVLTLEIAMLELSDGGNVV